MRQKKDLNYRRKESALNYYTFFRELYLFRSILKRNFRRCTQNKKKEL